MATRVVGEAFGAVIGAVALASRAETLAGWAADDHVDRPGADDGGQRLRGERGEVRLEGEGDGFEAGGALGLEIGAKGCYGLSGEVHGRVAVEAGALQAEGEATAAAEEVDERGAGRGPYDGRSAHRSIPSQSSETVVLSALAMRATLRIVGLRLPFSMPLM